MPDSNTDSIKEQVMKEYDVLAKNYDEKWLAYSQKTLALTFNMLEAETFEEGQSLLDIGCGTGQFLDMVSEYVPQLELYGIEPNLEMLTKAQAKFAERIKCVEAWAHDLPFGDNSFDYVTCNNMFHYVDEPLQALREFKRVLKSNGRLILMDWCGDFWTMRLNATYLDLSNKAHVKTYKQDELRVMLEDVGFLDIVTESKKVDLFWGMMVARASINFS